MKITYITMTNVTAFAAIKNICTFHFCVFTNISY